MKKPRLMIYVQNLLGIGHLRRAAGISCITEQVSFNQNQQMEVIMEHWRWWCGPVSRP